MPDPYELPVLRKPVPEEAPITPRSIALFRLGEACNNACEMCSNTGDPRLWHLAEVEALRRVEFLASKGFRRVLVTGGEPTIHPGFWSVLQALRERSMAFDLVTNGRAFASAAWAPRARSLGLVRAIVSLHSHVESLGAAISGTRPAAHRQTLRGLTHLVEEGADVMLNCVLCRLNAGTLCEYVAWAARRFGGRVKVKLAFPRAVGKGHAFEGIRLRYADVREEVRSARRAGAALGVRVECESIPNCMLGLRSARNLDRLGFGETHYLDDESGDRLHSIAFAESHQRLFGECCRGCGALSLCPGVDLRYIERFGTGELVPFETQLSD